MRRRKTKRLISVAALLCLAILAACSPNETGTEDGAHAKAEAPSAESSGINTTTQRTTTTPDTSGHCPEGNDGGRRLNDLAEHVHDTAVSEYLRENVVAFGRTSQPQDGLRALMLLEDDTAYELCVTVPERCLRAELLRTGSNAERDALLSSKGNYAYEKALACLERAGDAYAAHEPEPDISLADPAELDATYRERVLPRLVGNMMPVALLTESNFFGADNDELHRAAIIAWHECYDSLASAPLDPSELVRRMSIDKIDALECAEAFHEKMRAPSGPPAPSPPSP